MRVVAEIKCLHSDLQNPRSPHHQRAELFLRRDRDRLDVVGKVDNLDRSQEYSDVYRSVSIPSSYCTWSHLRDQADKPRVGMASHQHPDFDGVIGSYERGAALDGYLRASGGKRLAELALEAGNAHLRGQEVIDGKACHVVEAAHPQYGAITLWLSEEGGEVLMRKARFLKGANHLGYDGQPLSKSLLDLYDGVVDNVKFRSFGEATVPVSGRYTFTAAGKLYNGKGTMECSYVRTEIDPNPSFEGTDAFIIDLPNGSPVTNLDDRDSGVAYVWSDGKIVPASDYVAANATFNWGANKGRLIAALAIAALLLATGAFLWLKRRQPPEKKMPATT